MASNASDCVAGLARGFAPDRAALIVYLMAGYPDKETSLAALHAAARGGADIIELGVPYGDPLADGPTIAEAARAAREAGFGLRESIRLAEEFLSEAGPDAPPVALMNYLNPLMRMGLEQAAESIRNAGVAGVIVPDMPPDSAAPWLSVASGLDTVFLVAPTSTPERMQKVGERSKGFVYCVSTTGVTGERAQLAKDLAELVDRVRSFVALPVAVGFGVSGPAQVGEVARFADGVVVGSAVVRRQGDPAEVEGFVRELSSAVRAARS